MLFWVSASPKLNIGTKKSNMKMPMSPPFKDVLTEDIPLKFNTFNEYIYKQMCFFDYSSITSCVCFVGIIHHYILLCYLLLYKTTVCSINTS